MKLFKKTAVVLLVLLVCCWGCSDDDSSGESSSMQSVSAGSSSSLQPGSTSAGSSSSDGIVYTLEQFNTFIRQGAALVQPPVIQPPRRIGAPVTNSEGGVVTVTAQWEEGVAFMEQLGLQSNSDVYWPGALLDGNTVLSGDNIPIPGSRAPVTLSVSLSGIQGNCAATVNDPKLSTVRQAVSDLLGQQISGATPAQVNFTVSEIHSQDQLQLVLGGNFSAGYHSVQSQFDFTDNAVRSRVLVKFIQVYYTIDLDLPETPSDLFAAGSNWGDLSTVCSNKVPVYISSVSYGRLALFSFESSEDLSKLKAAVNYSCSGIVADGGANVEAAYKDLLNNSTIKATIIGGSGATAVSSVQGFEGLKIYLLSGGNYDQNSPGAPVSYKLRYLKDNSVMPVVSAAQYQTVEQYTAQYNYQVQQFHLICDEVDDAGGNGEFYGWCKVRAYTNGVAVPGFRNGFPQDETVWSIDELWANSNPLGAGDRKDFTDSGITFTINHSELDAAQLVVEGYLMEDDDFGDDFLGQYAVTNQLSLIQLEQPLYMTNFGEPGTTVRLGYSVILNQ